MQKLTDDQRKMVEDNLALVKFILNRKFDGVRPENWDDMFQDGAVGLCRAAMLYEPEKGIRFSSFASLCILNEIGNRSRRRLWLCEKELSYDNLLSKKSESDSFEDRLGSAEDAESQIRYLALRETIEKSFSVSDRFIIQMILKAATQKEIANAMGISQPKVSRRIKHIRGLICAKHGIRFLGAAS